MMSALPSTDSSFVLSATFDRPPASGATAGGVPRFLTSRGFLVSSVMIANIFVWVGLIKLATIVL